MQKQTSNTVGVIVEYNPFHNGHAYHLEMARKVTGADAVVAVMSGNWLQRGEPALMNKWARAEIALLSGVDLVLELPVLYSTQPAEWFAYGAVSALHATGIVDTLCFGSESGRIETLMPLAQQLAREPEPFAETLKENLKKGLPYPAAYAAAARQTTGLPAADVFDEPNNSLGFHYLTALFRLGSRIQPCTIQRVKAGYNDPVLPHGSIASATAIRRKLLEWEQNPDEALSRISGYVPAATLEVLRREISAGRAPMHWERFRTPLLHRLLTQPPEALRSYREVTEGLEYRIKKALPALEQEATVERLIAALKTKRYTRTKLQRMLTAVYLGHTAGTANKEELQKGVRYLHVLGFTDRGQKLLSQMKHTASVPIVTTLRRDSPPEAALEAAATAAYALGYASSAPEDWYADYYRPPVRISFSGSPAR